MRIRGTWLQPMMVAALGAGTILVAPLASPAVAADTIVVTTTDDGEIADDGVGCPAHDDDECTLRAAITEVADGGTVEVPDGVYELDDELGALEVTKSLVIRGESTDGTVVRPTGDHRIVTINAPGATVELNQLTLRDGGSSSTAIDGGAILIETTSVIDIERMRFSNNAVNADAGNTGGALHVQQATDRVRVADSTLEGNAANRGGAIFVEATGGPLTITGTEFTGNRAEGPSAVRGGAIYLGPGTGPTEISRARFADNTSDDQAAALMSHGAAPVGVHRSDFRLNQAQRGAAFVIRDGAELNVTNSSFVRNETVGHVALTAGSLLEAFGDAEATIRFSTIIDHDDAFSVSSAQVRVESSALDGVTGCDGVEFSNSLTGGPDDGCGNETIDVKLRDDIESPYLYPAHDSPLIDGADTDCPAEDQRGEPRDATCAIGAVDPAGIICPSGDLPRTETITCDLDVALPGPQEELLVRHEPDEDRLDVDVDAGAGAFDFVLSAENEATEVLVSVADGSYSRTLPVVPVTGDDDSDGSSGGDDGDSGSSDDGTGGDAGNGVGGSGGGGTGSGEGDGDIDGSGSNGGGPNGGTDGNATEVRGGNTDPDQPVLAATGSRPVVLGIAAMISILVGVLMLGSTQENNVPWKVARSLRVRTPTFR